MKCSFRWSPIPWLAVALAITALACGSEPDGAGAGNATGSSPGEAVVSRPSEPKWGTDLPDNFPDDIPVFPGARITKVRIAPDQGLAVSYITDGDVDEVIDYFADSFAAEGWSTDVRDMNPGRAVFADKAQRIASVVTSQGDEGTAIELLFFEMN